jgi:hypothetical protein
MLGLYKLHNSNKCHRTIKCKKKFETNKMETKSLKLEKLRAYYLKINLSNLN